jgi:Ulp1 family protease
MIESIENSAFLIAPICLNNNHWTCVLIDLKKSKFFYFDPYGLISETKRRETYLQRWTNYYNDAFEDSNKKWSSHPIGHPTQTTSDKTNCGVYICLFVSQYLEKNKIAFDNSPTSLIQHRGNIEVAISRNSLTMSVHCSICGRKRT